MKIKLHTLRTKVRRYLKDLDVPFTEMNGGTSILIAKASKGYAYLILELIPQEDKAFHVFRWFKVQRYTIGTFKEAQFYINQYLHEKQL